MKELLEKLGIEYKEDLTVEDAVSQIVESQRNLIANDASFIEPIKQKVVSEAQIVATKKAKKEYANAFELGLTNKELDEIDYNDLIKIGKDKVSKGGVNVDEQIKKLQADLIKVAREKEEIENTYKKKLEDTVKSYSKKENEKVFESELYKFASKKDFIIDKDDVVKVVKMLIVGEGVEPVFSESGLVFQKDGYEALKDDKTGKATLQYYFEKYASKFEKKSNGVSGAGQHSKTVDTKLIPRGAEAEQRILAAMSRN